jgi:hypothetical protein
LSAIVSRSTGEAAGGDFGASEPVAEIVATAYACPSGHRDSKGQYGPSARSSAIWARAADLELAVVATTQEALAALDRAWPTICEECLRAPGGVRHYQAVIYHALRTAGEVPLTQLGAGVRQFLPNLVSKYLRETAARRHSLHRELITDIVIFAPDVASDWRRSEASLRSMRLAINVVAAYGRDEGKNALKRLRSEHLLTVIRLLAAHREEVRNRFAKRELWSNRIEDRSKPAPPLIRVDPSDPDAFTEHLTITSDFHPVILVVDAGSDARDRLTPAALDAAKREAAALGVQWRYVSPEGCEIV